MLNELFSFLLVCTWSCDLRTNFNFLPAWLVKKSHSVSLKLCDVLTVFVLRRKMFWTTCAYKCCVGWNGYYYVLGNFLLTFTSSWFPFMDYILIIYYLFSTCNHYATLYAYENLHFLSKMIKYEAFFGHFCWEMSISTFTLYYTALLRLQKL